MAEIGLAASLIGIASFGVKLTTTLYEFGATASSAREQTDYIARHVSLYSGVLELLADRIDDDEPVHSNKALDLVDEIYDQSQDLFYRIRNLLPDRGEMTFMQKIAWNFKKSKVDLLVSEIDYLKSTVNLLVSVLYAGKKIRSYKRKKKSKTAKDDVDIQYTKVQNAIVEQLGATTAKADIQAKVDEEERLNTLSGTIVRREGAIANKSLEIVPILRHSNPITEFRTSLGSTESPSEERALIIHNSADLLETLIHHWTTLTPRPDDLEDESLVDQKQQATPSPPTPTIRDESRKESDRVRTTVYEFRPEAFNKWEKSSSRLPFSEWERRFSKSSPPPKSPAYHSDNEVHFEERKEVPRRPRSRSSTVSNDSKSEHLPPPTLIRWPSTCGLRNGKGRQEEEDLSEQEQEQIRRLRRRETSKYVKGDSWLGITNHRDLGSAPAKVPEQLHHPDEVDWDSPTKVDHMLGYDLVGSRDRIAPIRPQSKAVAQDNKAQPTKRSTPFAIGALGYMIH